jgi:hypothetical protein
MRSLLNDKDRAALLTRIASLTVSSLPRWGRMSVASMLAHLNLCSRMALGELPVKSAGMRAFQMFPLKQLLLYVVPFPKGARTAPELLAAEPGDIAAEQASLQTLMKRIGTTGTETAGSAHPLFGRLSRREWGALMYKHADHHLRQFGV